MQFFIISGDGGHYYCGMKVLSCACCDGICGPQMGCNCAPCQKLDEDEIKRSKSANTDEKPAPPFKQQINSWTWGPQPCNIIFKYTVLENPMN